MDLSPVLEFLRQKIGLNPETIGVVTVEKAVREHIARSGAVSIRDYINRLSTNPEDLNALVESIVVSETSFFRNKTPFKTLQSYLKQFFLDQRSGRPLRVLCLPCSTGEEPYSIAMLLLEMGLPPSQFFIFAADISDQCLQQAQAGIYSPYSFRGENLDYRTKYFSRQPDHSYLLGKEVRDTVHFAQANILADDFLPGHKPYDVIFCRNLLIYFDDVAKEKAVNALTRVLSEQGVLFVGHAEGGSVSKLGYVNLNYPMSFAFARKEYAAFVNNALHTKVSLPSSTPQAASAHQFAAMIKLISERPKAVATAVIQPVAIQSEKPVEIASVEKKSTAEEALLSAKNFADEGEYSQVVAICEGLLAGGGESAEVYFLLGQVAGSAGDTRLAEEYLKKAIYLNADFYDALIYFSLLLDRMGNPEKAATFRKRAERVKLRHSGDGEE